MRDARALVDRVPGSPGAAAHRRPGAAADRWLAAAAVCAVGTGVLLAAGTAAAGAPASSIAAAGALLLAGLVVLVAADWIDGLIIAALAVPLPALMSTPDMRVAAAAPLTAAVVLGWLLTPHASTAPQARRSPEPAARSSAARRRVTAATAALLGALAVAALFASSPRDSARELLNATVLFGFFLLAVGRAGATRGAQVVATIAGVAALCGVLAVLEMVGVLPGAFPRWGTPFNRAALGFGQPNALGLFLAVSLPLLVHFVRTCRGASRAAAWLGTGAATAGLFATFSRGSWLAVIAGAAALVLVRDRRLLGRFLAAAFVAMIVLDIASGGMIRDTAQRTLNDWVVEQRAGLMLAGVLMFLANPVVGVGPGGFAVELATYGPRIGSLWDYLPTPHNAYVQMAAETGVIGLAAFLAFLGICLAVLVRSANRAADAGGEPAELSLRRALVWSFAVACFAGMVVWPFSHGTGQAVLLLLAVGLARPVS